MADDPLRRLKSPTGDLRLRPLTDAPISEDAGLPSSNFAGEDDRLTVDLEDLNGGRTEQRRLHRQLSDCEVYSLLDRPANRSRADLHLTFHELHLIGHTLRRFFLSA
jgi:hypothetical protein